MGALAPAPTPNADRLSDALNPESRFLWDLTVAIGRPEADPQRWPRAWLGRNAEHPSTYEVAWAMLTQARQRLQARVNGALVAPLPLAMLYDGVEVCAYILGVHAVLKPKAKPDVYRAWWCAIDDAGDLSPTRQHCGHEHRSLNVAQNCAKALRGSWSAMAETAAIPVVVERS